MTARFNGRSASCRRDPGAACSGRPWHRWVEWGKRDMTGTSVVSERRNQGLCVDCGAKPGEEDLRHLPSVAERKARETGLPVARFLREGRCGPCSKKNSDAIKTAYEGKRDKVAAGRRQEQARHQRRAEAGLCVRCGTVSPTKGQTVCSECIHARGDRNKERVSERIATGVCTGCGKPKELEKYKTCVACREHISMRQRMKRKRDTTGLTDGP